MEIFINNEKTVFELESEKNSFEIISAISDFASKSKPQQFVTKININGKEFSFLEEDELKKINLKNIEKIEIETSDIYGITNLSIGQIENFLKLLHDVFNKNEWDSSLSKMTESISWMNKGIVQIIDIFAPNDSFLKEEKEIFNKNCNSLYDIFTKLKPKDFTDQNDVFKEAKDYINKLTAVLNNIKTSLINSFKLPDKDFIFNNINFLIKEIDEIKPRLENVPVLFQTGQDKESMIIIQKLADILEKSINLFVMFKESFKLHLDKYTIKEVTFEEIF